MKILTESALAKSWSASLVRGDLKLNYVTSFPLRSEESSCRSATQENGGGTREEESRSMQRG
ncbi:hypothetical protein AXX17_AT2G39750 [Arabidopsis thaliana]|uniref:Uncharacterized protein n=2 Tax=Arabidopsis TaxID=3701 RepID=A0A178VRU7_ARATH|nr:hypothetical protein AXX17_AT2G39750 [Arabidopsis thaliana]